MFVYVEIVDRMTRKVTHRIDCHGDNRRAYKVQDGVNINLNHDEFFTKVQSYDTEQEIDPKG